MIKALIAAGAAAFVVATVVPEAAEAANRSRVAKVKVKSAKGVAAYRGARRPASVGQNGLCQRDTGTPDSQLNFRNACDVEEYWNRVMDRSGSPDL